MSQVVPCPDLTCATVIVEATKGGFMVARAVTTHGKKASDLACLKLLVGKATKGRVLISLEL